MTCCTHCDAAVAVLSTFVNLARVGTGSTPVSKSKRVNVPASVWHDAKAALEHLANLPPLDGDIGQVSGASASGPGSRKPSPDGLGPTAFDPSRWVVHTIASALDFPSVYMGGPSRQSIATAKRVLDSLLALHPSVVEVAKGHVSGYPRTETIRAIWEAVIKCGLRYRDSDGSPEGRDAKRLDGEATTARPSPNLPHDTQMEG